MNKERVDYLIEMQKEYSRLVQEGIITDALTFYSWLSTFPEVGEKDGDRLGRALGLDIQPSGE